jgi:hypothetical protein
MSSYKTVHLLGTICVLRRRQLRALAESAEKLLERFGFRCCLARLVTGTQDCHGGTIEIGSNVQLKKIGQGDKGEAILSRRRVAALIQVWSTRSLLDTEIKRCREGRGGVRGPNTVSVPKFQVGPNWDPPGAAPDAAPILFLRKTLNSWLLYLW